MVKLQQRGHITAKMLLPPADGGGGAALTAADFGMAEGGGSAALPTPKSKNLYADATVPCFFRSALPLH